MRIKYTGPLKKNILTLRGGEEEAGTVRAMLIGDSGSFFIFYADGINDLHQIAPVDDAKILDLEIPNDWEIEIVDKYILDGSSDPDAAGKLLDKSRFGNLLFFLGEPKLNSEKSIIELLWGD